MPSQQREHDELALLGAGRRRRARGRPARSARARARSRRRAVEARGAAKQRSASCAIGAPARRSCGVGVEVLVEAAERAERRARRAARRQRGSASQWRSTKSPVSGCEQKRPGREPRAALLDDLEGNLVAGRDRRGERRGGLDGEGVQRGVEPRGLHAARFVRAPPILPAQPALQRTRRYARRRRRARRGRLRDLLAEPAAAVVRACSR